MPALANAKHEAVLQAYLASPERVGWRAYQAVYTKSSQRAAETAWSRLLKDAAFKRRFDELTAEVVERAVEGAAMDLREVLLELSKLGRADMRHYFNADGTFVGIGNLTPEQTAAISGLEIETLLEGEDDDDPVQVRRVKFKLHDKKGALAELLHHLEPQRHRHELTGKDGGPVETKDVNERPSELELARRIAFALEQGARQAQRPAAKPATKAKRKARGTR